MNGLQLLEKMRADKAMSQVPVIIYTGKELSKAEEAELRQLAQTIIIKDVKSPERLLDETTLFLHRVESSLPPEKQRLLDQLHRSDPTLNGKKALVVDDDIRNIFALTSILERHQMDVQYAENGHDALRMLSENPDIDVVLMDVMMPEMDGYEATRRIRDNAHFEDLPIIAITAKAMKGDREKCINAGRIGLRDQAGRFRPADRPAARVAVTVKRQVNILVVDDRDENLMALEAVLDDPGYRLVRAKSGREALKEVLEQDFALILLDVVMPGVDGYETATLIRERPRSRQTPIIFLTANDFGVNYVFRGYTVGAVDYLVKPVPADVLRSKVAVFVELFNRQEALRIGQEELESKIAERTQGAGQRQRRAVGRDRRTRQDREGARAAAAPRAGGAPRSRARQSAQGRVPGDAVARAADAAERDHGLGARAQPEHPRSRHGAARGHRDSPERDLTGAADRRHPRRLAHRRRPAHHRERHWCRSSGSSTTRSTR